MMKLAHYNTLVFDCDGVILNSNTIKTQAFYESARHFGHKPAQALVDYHMQKGGISRYVKFEYFITNILKQPIDYSMLDDLLARFAVATQHGLMTCEVAEGLPELKEKTKGANWLVVSGSEQTELRRVFVARGLAQYFDGGIFGSPDTKDMTIEREKHNQNILNPALYLGDSQYDYEAAKNAKLDFVFLSDWSEWTNYQSYIKQFCDVKRTIKELS